jgi:AcrR family transcriptional regulator
LGRVREAVATIAAERGGRTLVVEGVVAEAGVSRRTFYNLFGGIEDAIVDAIEAAEAYATPQIVAAFEAQRSRQLGVRAAVITALDLLDRDRRWATLCLRERYEAWPQPSGGDSAGVAAIAAKLQGATGDRGGALAAVDAVIAAARTHLDASTEPLAALADDLTVAALALVGERRRDTGTRVVASQGPAALERLDAAMDRVIAGDEDAVAEVDALLVAAAARREGVVLWRCFVHLHAVRRGDGPESRRELMELVLEGLDNALHFGLPVLEIAAGTASERWLPADNDRNILRFLRAHPGSTAAEIRLAVGVRDARYAQRILERLHGRRLVRWEVLGPARQWWAEDASGGSASSGARETANGASAAGEKAHLRLFPGTLGQRKVGAAEPMTV